MKIKAIFTSVLLSILWCSYSSQSQDLSYKDIFSKAAFIKVYKINRKSKNCADQKNATLFTNNVINSCFRFQKTLNNAATKQLVNVLLKKDSFGVTVPECFTSDYGVVLFDERKKIIGSITMSTNCNNISINQTVLKTLTDKAMSKVLYILK